MSGPPLSNPCASLAGSKETPQPRFPNLQQTEKRDDLCPKILSAITDQEMAFAHLVLSGTMNDRQAAEAVG
jgi:hypothetical protein